MFFVWGSATWGQTTTWAVVLDETGGTASTSAVEGVPEVLVEAAGIIDAASATFAESGLTEYVAPDGSSVYVTATTARLYERLPAVYRDVDAVAGVAPNDRPLLRWLACLVDQAGEIESIIDRCTSPTSSALTDPNTADTSWLPWQAQLIGFKLPPNLAPADASAAVASALSGPQHGTRPAIMDAVRPFLSGTQTVTVTDHAGGDPWTIQVTTKASETPAVLPDTGTAWMWGTSIWGQTTTWYVTDPILSFLLNLGMKPAGFTLTHTEV